MLIILEHVKLRAMAFRVELSDETSLDYGDNDTFEIVHGGALMVRSFQMRVTYAPNYWRRVLEQGV
jgi:hypothetical protein